MKYKKYSRGKQIFSFGRFPEVGQKQKTERKERGKMRRDWTMVITMGKLRMAHASRLGQFGNNACMVIQMNNKYFKIIL